MESGRSYSPRYAFWNVEGHIAESCSLESGRSYNPRHALWKLEGPIFKDMQPGKWKVKVI